MAEVAFEFDFQGSVFKVKGKYKNGNAEEKFLDWMKSSV